MKQRDSNPPFLVPIHPSSLSLHPSGITSSRTTTSSIRYGIG